MKKSRVAGSLLVVGIIIFLTYKEEKDMFKNMKKKFKNQKGLTLVELLAVIVILAIIGAIAFVFIGGIIDNSKKDAHIANAQQIISAAKLYEATEGDLPTEDAAMTIEGFQTGNYLEKVLDPWDKADYDVADTATVTKVDGDFTITGFNSNDSSKCSITATEQELLTEDRDTICN